MPVSAPSRCSRITLRSAGTRLPTDFVLVPVAVGQLRNMNANNTSPVVVERLRKAWHALRHDLRAQLPAAIVIAAGARLLGLPWLSWLSRPLIATMIAFGAGFAAGNIPLRRTPLKALAVVATLGLTLLVVSLVPAIRDPRIVQPAPSAAPAPLHLRVAGESSVYVDMDEVVAAVIKTTSTATDGTDFYVNMDGPERSIHASSDPGKPPKPLQGELLALGRGRPLGLSACDRSRSTGWGHHNFSLNQNPYFCIHSSEGKDWLAHVQNVAWEASPISAEIVLERVR